MHWKKSHESHLTEVGNFQACHYSVKVWYLFYKEAVFGPTVLIFILNGMIILFF